MKDNVNIVYEKTTNKSFDLAISSLKESLKENSFGVLWELDFKKTFNNNDLSFTDEYTILEVCNPFYAKQIMDKNIHLGYILPCKMIVRTENNQTFIGMANPDALIKLFNDDSLNDIAKTVLDLLNKAINEAI